MHLHPNAKYVFERIFSMEVYIQTKRRTFVESIILYCFCVENVWIADVWRQFWGQTGITKKIFDQVHFKHSVWWHPKEELANIGSAHFYNDTLNLKKKTKNEKRTLIHFRPVLEKNLD